MPPSLLPSRSPLLIFANPISGRGRGKRIAERLERRLTAEGYSVRLLLERADRVAREQLDPAALAAIVIGGDGTLRAVAGRLFGNAGRQADKGTRGQGEGRNLPLSPFRLVPLSSASSLNPPLLVIPMGTANLMGKHLGIRWDHADVEAQVLETLRSGQILRLDTARANGELMLLVAGVGLDGMIVHELQKRRSGPISYLSYAAPALSAVGRYGYPPLTVWVDGREIFGPAPGMVFVGNVAEYGTGFPILPLASPTDGVLDVCVLPCRSRGELMWHALRAAAGEHLHGEGVVYVKGASIRVDSPQAVPVQVDGEAAGHTPLQIDLLPGRLGFIVPHQLAVGS